MSDCRLLLFVDQREEVGGHGLVEVGGEVGALVEGGVEQELLQPVDGVDVEGVGGDAHLLYPTLAHLERERDVAPVEVAAGRGGEVLPAVGEPGVAAIAVVQGPHPRVSTEGVEVDDGAARAIDGFAGGDETRLYVLDSDVGQRAEVDDTALHGRDTMFGHLGFGGHEVALQVLHVAVDEQRAVVQIMCAPFGKGVATELSE